MVFIHSLGQIVSVVGEFWGQTTLSVYIFSWLGGYLVDHIYGAFFGSSSDQE